MIFVGCSTPTEYIYIKEPTPVPQEVIKHPVCEDIKVGEDVLSLVIAYLGKNTCLKEYESVVEGVHKYNNTLMREKDARGIK